MRKISVYKLYRNLEAYAKYNKETVSFRFHKFHLNYIKSPANPNGRSSQSMNLEVKNLNETNYSFLKSLIAFLTFATSGYVCQRAQTYSLQMSYGHTNREV